MALSGATIWEIETGGDDTNNGGAFDTGQTAGMFTDGAATSATGNSPVFSSASYNFVAGDVGAWVYISSGTNWINGWYKIASVASNQATLDAAIGHAVINSSFRYPNSTAGCATTASPTAATWTIDYSQQSTAKFAYTDLASAGAGLTVSSAAHPFAKQQVGNCIVVISGTNFTAGRYVIASVAASVATVVGPGNITTGAGSGGTGGLGGCLASPAMPPIVANNFIYIKSGTYSITTSTNNVSGGTYNKSAAATVEGYGTVRGDLGTAPVYQSTVNTITMWTHATAGTSSLRNIVFDGNSKTANLAFTANGSPSLYNCTAKNCTNGGFENAGGTCWFFNCLATNITGDVAFKGSNATIFFQCEAYGNTVVGFSGGGYFIQCLSYNNTGATVDGFVTTTSATFINCVAYGNGRHGFSNSSASAVASPFCINCIAEGNTGTGYIATNNSPQSLLPNCAAYNNGTNVSTQFARSNVLILTGSPFVDGANGNFALNNTSGAGASCRGTGTFGLTPRGTSTGYLDIGAIQHQLPSSGFGSWASA